ncbi:MAG: hypothetical protein F4088_07210 [Chloroflexi bacterium]|nr:hypothetical protein [Chloroflexota bacterium]MYJ58627.1 hypothetical protein [Chloroflexota bacterium]
MIFLHQGSTVCFVDILAGNCRILEQSGIAWRNTDKTEPDLEESGQIWTNPDTATHDPQPETGDPAPIAEYSRPKGRIGCGINGTLRRGSVEDEQAIIAMPLPRLSGTSGPGRQKRCW